MPKSRSDSGRSRCLDDECQEFIRHMKESYPRMPASMIYRALLDNGLISRTSASESSVSRFVNQLMAENRMTNNKDMRRYERPHINEVWCGDSSVGPRMITESGKKKVYIIALIDDASRFCGAVRSLIRLRGRLPVIIVKTLEIILRAADQRGNSPTG